MRRVRVLLLTQWFDPEPTVKGLAFARELVAQGFDVEVLTGFPNYPGGKLYPGYRLRLLQRELIDEVTVTRVPLYPSHDGSPLRRVANYLSFGLAATVYGLLCAKRPDVVYAYHPPLTVGLAAAALKILRRTPVVYDIQDMWPDTLRATGMLNNKTLLNVVAKFCQWVYRRMDRIVVLSPGFRAMLIERGVPAESIEVIYNWCDESALGGASVGLPDEFPGDGTFKVVFAGNMGKAQALETVIDAARDLAGRRPEVCFVLVGSGIELDRLKAMTAESGLQNVVFVPRLPMNEVRAVLEAADALLVHLRDDPLFKSTIPSKTQAYMAIGKPLLMGVRGDAADLVSKASCGYVIEPEDPKALADAVVRLFDTPRQGLDKMGAAAQRYYSENLSLSIGVGRFAAIFRSLSRKAIP